MRRKLSLSYWELGKISVSYHLWKSSSWAPPLWALQQPRTSVLCLTRGWRFSDHVSEVVRRCTGILSGLSHSRHYLPKATLATLVQALAISSIRYSISVYGVCGVTQMSRLQRLINFGARVVSGRRKYDHISDVLKQLRWLSAVNMWRFQSVTLLTRALVGGGYF